MKKSWVQTDKGFTMIELLMVAGMLAVLMTAIYSIYRTQQRSAYVQDDVVEVQQNLRIALDSITKDIRMSGLLLRRNGLLMLPIGTSSNNTGMGSSLNSVTGQQIAATSDSVTLNSISSSAALAMAWIDLTNAAPKKDEQRGAATPFIVDSADSVDRFIAGAVDGDLVKILRPENMNDPTALQQIYRVTAKDRVAPSLTLTQLPGAAGGPSAATHDFFTGDLIIKVPSNAPNPCTIRYFITNNAGVATCPVGLMCLAKVENEFPGPGTTSIVATNITNLQFSYIKGGTANLQGSDDHTPTGPGPTDEVRAVRVAITGLTNASVGMSDNQTKMRTLTSIVKLNNKK
jgi:prepilin-type N-terminal cleavage/methylation domain-containing protein